ncbi:MAG: phosphodiester glycosidase family protein, partial [Staphylococcus equorum]|nr:phosphodiester glycosidase family protein [Staphylococcus equorum]
GNFRRYLVDNTYSINRNFLEVVNIINNHKRKNEIQHYSKQIEHNSQSLNRVLNRLEGRINNQVYGEEYEGMNEVVDARVDIDGNRHGNLQSRLKDDFETIEKISDTAEKLAKKHEEEIENTIFYEDVDYVSGRKFDSTYKILTIPKEDKDGNMIKIKRGIEGDDPSHPEHITAREFANRRKATAVINASTGSGSRLMLHGQQIYNGEILDSVKQDQYSQIKDRWTLAIGDNNELEAFPQTVSAKEIKGKGYNNTISGFGPLITEGKTVYSEGDYTTTKSGSHPRSVIGKLPDGTIFFFTCDGRVKADGIYQKGMTLGEVIDTLYDHFGKVDFAYNMDGGGSTSLVYRSRLLNKTTDNNNKSERNVLDFLYVGKDETEIQPRDKDISELNRAVGDLRSAWQNIYGLYANLKQINNAEFRLTDYNRYTGFVTMDGDEAKKKFYMNDDGFRFWDYELGQTVFRVNAKDDEFQYRNKELARNFSNPETVRNVNNIKYGGTYHILSGTKGSPFQNESSGILHQQNITKASFEEGDDAIVLQQATPFIRSGNYGSKRRSYNGVDGWSDWFDL